jgi:photosystem II stability/assembly factor-like uncharacterized protein
VGSLGIILSTTNADSPGEPGWDYTNETVTQHGVACLDSKTCYSVGAFGSILATTNGGSRWDGQGVSHTNLFGVACRNTTVPNVIPSYCFAVGDSHTILRSLDEGQWGVGGP